jgi:serine/threonine protein kinase
VLVPADSYANFQDRSGIFAEQVMERAKNEEHRPLDTSDEGYTPISQDYPEDTSSSGKASLLQMTTSIAQAVEAVSPETTSLNAPANYSTSCDEGLIKRRYPDGTITPLPARDGAESICYRVDLPGQPPVLAKIRTSFRRFDEIKRESEIHKTLSHPRICKWIGQDVATDTNLYTTFTEFANGVTCPDLIGQQGPLTADKALDIIKQVLETCKYLHSPESHTGYPHAIIHRDINPNNLVVDTNGEIKVIDFGIATPKRSLTQYTIRNAGTPGYTAPEIHSLKPVPESDIYSVGATFLYLLLGELPKPLQDINFRTPQYFIPNTLEVRLSKDQPLQPIPEELRTFLQKAIMLDAEQRFHSADEALRELCLVDKALSAQQSFTTTGTGDTATPIELVTHSVTNQHQSSLTPDQAVLELLSDRIRNRESFPINNPALQPLATAAWQSRLSVADVEDYLRRAALTIRDDHRPCETVSELIERYRPLLGCDAIQTEISAHFNATPTALNCSYPLIPSDYQYGTWPLRVRGAENLRQKQRELEESEDPESVLCSLIVGAVACRTCLAHLEDEEMQFKDFHPSRLFPTPRVKHRYEKDTLARTQNLAEFADASFRFATTAAFNSQGPKNEATIYICLQMPSGATKFLMVELPRIVREKHPAWRESHAPNKTPMLFKSFDELQKFLREARGFGVRPRELTPLPDQVAASLNSTHPDAAELSAGTPGEWLNAAMDTQRSLDQEAERRYEELQAWKNTVFTFTNSLDGSKKCIDLAALVALLDEPNASKGHWYQNTPGLLQVDEEGRIWAAVSPYRSSRKIPDSRGHPVAKLLAIGHKIVLCPFLQVPLADDASKKRSFATQLLSGAKQFLVHARSSTETKQFDARCEELKRDALAAFQIWTATEKDNYKYPATVYLSPDGELRVIHSLAIVVLGSGAVRCFDGEGVLRLFPAQRGGSVEPPSDPDTIDVI